MSKVILIPGLGADCRIYKNIDFAGYDLVNIVWIEPDRNDTLASYAQKLIDHYHITSSSIVIGNSLGGMLAIEIAKKINLSKTILISSIKTAEEMPKSFKWYRRIPLYKLMPRGLIGRLGIFVKVVMGQMSANDQWLFIDMLKHTPPRFVKWAMGAILKWDNQIVPGNVYHITGDRDLIFPHERIKGATILKNGTHIMILNRAKEINQWLKNILSL